MQKAKEAAKGGFMAVISEVLSGMTGRSMSKIEVFIRGAISTFPVGRGINAATMVLEGATRADIKMAQEFGEDAAKGCAKRLGRKLTQKEYEEAYNWGTKLYFSELS